jgi:hypothetical protein
MKRADGQPEEGVDEPLSTKRIGDEGAMDDALMADLAKLAAGMTLEPRYAAALESRVQQAHRASIGAPTASYGRWGLPFRLTLRPAYGLALALLCSLVVAIPVLAQMGVLRYFVPYEVAQFPQAQLTPGPNPLASGTIQPRPARDPAELSRTVGFAVLVPAYLPDACPLLQYASVPEAGAAYLSYSCVDILEQRPLADWRNNPLRQPVGPNAVQALSFDGRPAYYIEGAWQFAPPQQGTTVPPVWSPTGARRLVLERGSLLLDIAAIPESITNGVPVGLISREELIAIAQSLK